MKIYGTFIGVNKHRSSEINELTSAVRDAQSLWALFGDTFPDLEGELLLNDGASSEAIKMSITKTLGATGPNDIALVSFSGHGTRSHRLVPFDADRAALDTTTVPMEFLAEAFKTSKARVIICILDCCFSGGAPAKVFADTPAPRDLHDPYEMLKGKGRILIAASNAAQPAWERPGVGHGLLTEAVIRILKTGEKFVDVTAAVFQIMDIVQAEAARIGVTQTPVVLSLVEGGLTIPALVEGAIFKSTFPDKQGKQVSRNIADLSSFNFPTPILDEWIQRFPDGLNNLQLKAVNDFKILDDQSLLVVAPTSSGKTFVGELAAVRAITSGRKAVFLFPYRALVNEKYEQFTTSYSDKLGLRVIRCNGDYSDQASTFVKGQFDLAVLTFEMFLNLVISSPGVLNQLGLVVLDEAQFITDPGRGINIELLLTCVLAARERGVRPQIIALSAVIGEVNKFDAWLGLQLLHTLERPVPLIEGVIDRTGTFQLKDTDGSIKEVQLLPRQDIRVRKEKASAQDVIVPLVSSLVEKGEKVLVFRNMRGSAQGCANYLASDLGLPAAQSVIARLPDLDQSAASQALRRSLSGGTAFHTSNLSREEREVIESGFRDPKGEIAVLAATTTVAAGINTPASTVIIAEQEFIGEDGRAFTVAEYKNMAGRAGRLGFKEVGTSIIYAETGFQRAQLFQKYVLGRIENMSSSFDPNSISTWVVRLLAQVKLVPRNDIVKLLANTYGGYLAASKDASWPQKMTAQVEALVGRMLSLGLLEEEGDSVQLTLLGRACGNSSLKFESALRLVELIRASAPSRLDPLALIALVQILQESDDTYTSMFKKGNGESKRVQEAQTRFGRNIVAALQKYAGDQIGFYARCKRACVLYDWIKGVSVEKIEATFSYTPYAGAVQAGDIRRFADNTRFHLRSAFQIAMIVSPDSICTQEEFDGLLKQLEIGIPAEAVGLLKFPIPLNRGEYLSLFLAGAQTPNQVNSMSEKQLIGLLGENRAKLIVSTSERQKATSDA